MKRSFFSGLAVIFVALALITVSIALFTQNISAQEQISGGKGGIPSGVAAGALTGTYPNPTIANLTTVGSVPYVSATGTLNQDPTVFFWDATNNRLGVGTATPTVPLEVLGNGRFYSSVANPSIYLGEDTTNASSASLAYNRGTANLDITPRSTYATNLAGKLKFSITNSTGANSVSLGANSPATITTAPYTWITVTTSDGTTGFMPIWK